MLFWLAGVLAGLGNPFQTGMNLRLRQKFGSPFVATLISFVGSLLFLLLVLFASGQTLHYPIARLIANPLWIWTGGVIGVIFLTGNILLLPRIGGVQTVIFPVFGQIAMSLIIDQYGLFYAPQTPVTALRILGATLVVVGVLIVSLAKQRRSETTSTAPAATPHLFTLWLWRLFAVVAGSLGAMQVAVNGYLGKVVESPIKSAIVSFMTGILLLIVICVVLALVGKLKGPTAPSDTRVPLWSWFGGILGACFVLVTVILSPRIGTGTTIICVLMGATLGGVIVDHWELFGMRRQPINLKKAIGIVLMIAGAAMSKLLV